MDPGHTEREVWVEMAATSAVGPDSESALKRGSG